jgi:UDP-N-acetylmuramoylalanine--D-glutamate ligase
MMKAAIIGSGKSGLAAERLLRSQGIEDITIFDDLSGKPLAEFKDTFDLVIISPGISPRKIPNYPKKFTSEIELGLDNLPSDSRVIAITGTDGKSTTTTLTAQILNGAGHRAVACGNFGYPLADAVLDYPSGTIFVVELSSYQIDLLQQKPYFDAACILNIAQDHLDRYGTMENYVASKERLGGMLKQDGKFFRDVPSADIPGFKLPGAHNKSNLGFAISLAGAIVQLPKDLDVSNLAGLEHRIELVQTKDGLHWYDDSKGTTVQAVLCALTSFDSNVILMLGGRDKELDFAPLADNINSRCDAVVLFGEAAQKIDSQLNISKPKIMAGNLKNAVEKARTAAKPGATILLSPGCTSWDEFKNFEERGNKFKEYINE